MDTNNPNNHTLPPVHGDDTAIAGVSPAAQAPLAAPQTGTPAPQFTPMPGMTAPMADDMPPDAGDIDLIEKAWVIKAKAIVNNTQGDPYTQNRELSKVKADYIRKRFGRDVKFGAQESK